MNHVGIPLALPKNHNLCVPLALPKNHKEPRSMWSFRTDKKPRTVRGPSALPKNHDLYVALWHCQRTKIYVVCLWHCQRTMYCAHRSWFFGSAKGPHTVRGSLGVPKGHVQYARVSRYCTAREPRSLWSLGTDAFGTDEVPRSSCCLLFGTFHLKPLTHSTFSSSDQTVICLIPLLKTNHPCLPAGISVSLFAATDGALNQIYCFVL